MSTGTQTCEIVLPGYTLTERIGSGGYAEVWRAEAPGGIEKAVKIVYGYYDDEFASQELKALERIKGVRHPFLLSLERFEILNGRLAILTELADMSLDQRLRQCRGEGLIGIPREELLRYMSDAAEALDFLSQRHSLLHLDIKPENLLVLGDHIKVADFGLVKEIATRTQNSLVSGMTPTYAAPEIFDDDPSAHSDQYSLAIVYQEMLVGTLPFPGRTAAQLAKQHTQAEPQLAPLPADDRHVIARALAKKPADRYESCKAFVEALQDRSKTTVVAPPTGDLRSTSIAPITSSPETGDTTPPSYHPTIRVSPESIPEQDEVQVTQPLRRPAPVAERPEVKSVAPPEPLVPEEVIDVAVPPANVELSAMQPTLYIAAGGVGIQVLCRLRARLGVNDESRQANALVESIALDTDRDELRQACSGKLKAPLSPDDTLHVPLKLPQNYDNSREMLDWVSRRWLYNIPRSLETRGYRPLGRVALIDHAKQFIELVDRKLESLAGMARDAAAAGNSCDSTMKVVVLASMGGGTGAGMVVDIGNAVRTVAANQNLQVEVHAYLVCTCLNGNNTSPLLAANTYALLTELNHAATYGNQSANKKLPLAELFESQEPPFDHTYCVPARAQKSDAHWIDAPEVLAQYLSQDRSADARAALRTCRSTPTPREQTQTNRLKLKKLGYASLGNQTRSFLHELAIDLANSVKRFWTSKDSSADWDALVRAAQQNATAVPQIANADDESPAPAPHLAPVVETSPMVLRGRFEAYKSLEFASEVIRQVQSLHDVRDHRGRPRIVPRDIIAIVDKARAFAGTYIANGVVTAITIDRFASCPSLRSLVASASRQAVEREIQEFDPTRPERCFELTGIDDRIRVECLSLLQQRLADPDVSAAIAPLMDAAAATSATLDSATSNLLGCGCDRRTLIFIPRGEKRQPATEELQKNRPLSAVVPADVDDVIVVSEESALSTRSFAMGLERMYPGIADAAHRLQTRIDVPWENLI